jgi:class 3 adenylate cyclase
MEPRIQYAQTKDGVSIAFWTLGEGEPFVHLPLMPYGHIEMEWQMPEIRRWYESIAKKRRVITYDRRGGGLSDQNVTDYSLDSLVIDIEAVVDHLRLDRFVLLGGMRLGPVAIAYATRHAERVSHLILWSARARNTDMGTADPALRKLAELVDIDWELFTLTAAHRILGWSDSERARKYAALLRKGATPESFRAYEIAVRRFDATDFLPDVRLPTLVMQPRQANPALQRAGKTLASRVPGARLLFVDCESGLPWYEDAEAAINAIDEFLGEDEEAAAPELPEGMAVLLFADIAESTALTERLGDAAFRAKARELDASLRAVISECSGTPVEGKVLGDGVLAVFTSARQAIECALRCNAASGPVGLQLHLGIHAGDVIREGNNVYGGAVNIAARIAGASAPGEVLVSDTVRGLARTSAGVTFDDRGERSLKGVADPQRLFAVRGGG